MSNEGILVIARLEMEEVGMAAVDMDVGDMVAADADMVDTVAGYGCGGCGRGGGYGGG